MRIPLKPDSNAPGAPSPDGCSRRRWIQTTALATAGMLIVPNALALPADGHALLLQHHPQPPRAVSSDDAYGLLRDGVLASLNLIPTVGGFLSYIGALVIPAAGESPEAAWRRYTDQKVSESLFASVRADLVGLSDVVSLYIRTVASGDAKAVQGQSIAANSLMTALLPRFQIPAEALELLPLFAIGATLHLALLRDIALTGKAVGFEDAYVQFVAEELTTRIASYTRHADLCQRRALEKVRDDNPTGSEPDRRNQPMSAMLEKRTSLYLTVLDQRDTWYAFDSRKHPGRTEVYLTREVFTPVIGWWDSASTPPTELPAWPAPAGSLDQISAWSDGRPDARYLTGFSCRYSDGNETKTGTLKGEVQTPDLGAAFLTVDQVRSHVSAAMGGIEVRSQPGGRQTLLGREPGRHDRTVTSAVDQHRLSSVRAIGRGKDHVDGMVSGCVLGFQLVHQARRGPSVEVLDRVRPHLPRSLLAWLTS